MSAVSARCARALPAISANIEVVSIVDRFLEHSRIYYFLNGGDEQVYLASADWMTRNLDHRVELMFPLEGAAHKAQVLHALRSMFRDNVKARQLGADGVYRRVTPQSGDAPFRVQQVLLEEAQRRAAQARERAGVPSSRRTRCRWRECLAERRPGYLTSALWILSPILTSPECRVARRGHHHIRAVREPP